MEITPKDYRGGAQALGKVLTSLYRHGVVEFREAKGHNQNVTREWRVCPPRTGGAE